MSKIDAAPVTEPVTVTDAAGDEVNAKDEKSSNSKAPLAEAIAEELEKVLKINQGLSIVPEPASVETINNAVLILYNNHRKKEGEVETPVATEGESAAADQTPVNTELAAADGTKDGHSGGRRRTKRKGRKVSRKSKKGGKRQHQSSKNGGRSRKYSRRRKH